MKKIILLLFLAAATVGYSQKTSLFTGATSAQKIIKSDTALTGATYELKKAAEDEEVYGRAFLMIQTSSEPSDALKKWLIDIPKKLWKDDKIIIYIGVQIGKPGGCGSPGRPPC